MDGYSLYWSSHYGDNPVLNFEVWKDIDDLPYQVSNLGTVRRHPNAKYNYKGRTHVKPYVNHKGYKCVNLYKNSKVYKFQIHRLIAIYFIPNPLNKPLINHVNGIKQDNSIDNLEWVTHQENCQHAWDTGLQSNRATNASVKRKNTTSKYVGVSWSASRQRWCAGIGVNKKRISLGRYKSETEAAKAYDDYVIDNNLFELGYTTNFKQKPNDYPERE